MMALSLEGKFWGPWFRFDNIPEIERVREALLMQMLPALPDAAREAEAHQQAVWDAAMSQASDGSGDPGDLAEWAQEKGIERFRHLAGVRQAAINMAAVMLWHLLEQQILSFHHGQVLTVDEKDEALNDPNVYRKLYTLTAFQDRLEEGGFGLDRISVWAKVDELRLLANTVKHGAGVSAKQLHCLRPDLFSPPGIGDITGGFPPGALKVMRPAAGEDLFATEQDLVDYFDAAVAFWGEFSALIQG